MGQPAKYFVPHFPQVEKRLNDWKALHSGQPDNLALQFAHCPLSPRFRVSILYVALNPPVTAPPVAAIRAP